MQTDSLAGGSDFLTLGMILSSIEFTLKNHAYTHTYMNTLPPPHPFIMFEVSLGL